MRKTNEPYEPNSFEMLPVSSSSSSSHFFVYVSSISVVSLFDCTDLLYVTRCFSMFQLTQPFQTKSNVHHISQFTAQFTHTYTILHVPHIITHATQCVQLCVHFHSKVRENVPGTVFPETRSK